MRHAAVVLTAVAAALLVMSGSAEGHHGWVEFDMQKEVTLKGTVTAFHWTNPHCVIEFTVKDDKGGKPAKWQAETSSLSSLSRKGWSAVSLEPGDQIEITGNPTKHGAKSMWVTKLVANGKVLKEGGGYQ
jgi:hypothetical protein